MPQANNNVYYIDEQVARIIGAAVIILTLVIVVSQWKLPAIFLVADFALRAFTRFPSPLSLAARFIQKRLGIRPRPVFAAPKKFAAALGFVFALAILILLYSGLTVWACSVGGVLLLCALLESAFKICLGCYVYHWIVAPLTRKPYVKPQENEN